jgi:hypothetical protein
MSPEAVMGLEDIWSSSLFTFLPLNAELEAAYSAASCISGACPSKLAGFNLQLLPAL